MKALIILVFFLFPPIASVVAQDDMRNLLSRIPNAPNDSTLISIYSKIGHLYYQSGKVDSAKLYLHKELKLAQLAKLLYWETSACQNIGIMCLYIPEPDSATWYFKKVIQLTEGCTEKRFYTLRSKAFANLGMNYGMNLNKPDKEIEYYLKALEIAQAQQLGGQAPNILWRISNFYLDQGKFEEARKNAQEGINIAEKEGKQSEIMDMRRLMGVIIAESSSSKTERLKGLGYLKSALGFYIQNNTPVNQIDIYLDIGDLYFEELEKDSAIWYSRKAYELTKQMQTGANQVTATITYAKALIKASQPQKAIPLLNEANKLTETFPSFQHQAAIHEWMAKAYENMGDYKKALLHQQICLIKSDSAHQQLLDGKALDLQTKFETDKKEQENKLLRRQNELITTRSNLYGISGLLLAALLLSGLLFYYKIKKNNRKLEAMNASKNQLFAILAHDLKGPASAFQNLTGKVNYLIKKQQPERLLEMSEHFESAGRQINYILNNLLDWAVSQKDQYFNNPTQINLKSKLEAAVEEMRYLSQLKNITIKMDMDERHQVFLDENAIAIVARNLLHNALKYAQPNGQVTIRSIEKNQIISLEITDDGSGISQETMQKILSGTPVQSRPGTQDEKGNAIGLQTCLKLIRQNKAKLFINSEEGKGATFRVVFG